VSRLPADVGNAAGVALSADGVPWLQPYPDHLLDGVVASEDQPDAAIVSRETIEIAYLVAIQHLPPRTRTVLILRDVLGWSASETATLLDSSVAAANSALQRARATLKKHLPERRLEWAAGTDPDEAERALLQRYMEATERGDAQAVAAILSDDVRFSMPPEPGLYVGRDVVVGSWVQGGFGAEWFGRFRCMPTRANRQPAVACYLRHPGESDFRLLAIDVLRIENGAIAEIMGFGVEALSAFGLPETLSP
jgi:RNA polymerase sigma-70 factor (ECF subfamily)